MELQLAPVTVCSSSATQTVMLTIQLQSNLHFCQFKFASTDFVLCCTVAKTKCVIFTNKRKLQVFFSLKWQFYPPTFNNSRWALTCLEQILSFISNFLLNPNCSRRNRINNKTTWTNPFDVVLKNTAKKLN